MKKIISVSAILFTILVCSIRVSAQPTDLSSPQTAKTSPCVTVQHVIDLVNSGSCQQSERVTSWFHICKGEEVNNKKVDKDDFVANAYICPSPQVLAAKRLEAKHALEKIERQEAWQRHMEFLGTIAWWSLIPLAVLLVILAFSTAYTVEQQTIAMIETWGKFNRAEPAGLHFKYPLIERIAKSVDLKVRQMYVTVETKTNDDVTVSIKVAIQYVVQDNFSDVFNAAYKLEDPEHQIKAYVLNVIRAHVPSQKLDEVYANKELDAAIESEVREKMKTYGWTIIDAPVAEIVPDDAVKTAMNQVNAQKRLLEATRSAAEAEKIKVEKDAEAQAIYKEQQGKGTAKERIAIAQGLRESAELIEGIGGISSKDAMETLLMVQYFDTLQRIGANSNTIMLPSTPGGLSQILSELRNAFVEASLVDNSSKVEKVVLEK